MTVAITTHGTHIIDLASGATFTSAMCHSGSGCTGATDQPIFLSGIGSGGANFSTTITQVNSAHQITVAEIPPTILTGSAQDDVPVVIAIVDRRIGIRGCSIVVELRVLAPSVLRRKIVKLSAAAEPSTPPMRR